MKLLVFTPYYPPHIGGVEDFSLNLHCELQKHSISITVFTPAIPSSFPKKKISLGEARIFRFPAFEIVTNYPVPKIWKKHFQEEWKKLQEESFDVVISHTRFFSTSLLALFFAWRRDIPLIHIEHGSTFVQSGNVIVRFIARIFDETFGKFILKKADCVVAISSKTAQFISQFSKKTDIPVIRRGFDARKIEAILPNKNFPKNPNLFRILFIGRLVRGKGVHILLEALQYLSQKGNIRWECFIIGEGPERTRLEEISYSQKERIQFLGLKSWDETVSFLKTSDIFINPSLSEGLPTTVAEASLCAKAVIATNVGGTHELFHPDAKDFLIPANNSAIMAEKIRLLLKDDILRKNIGEKQKKFVSENFSWKKTSEEYSNLFQEIIHRYRMNKEH